VDTDDQCRTAEAVAERLQIVVLAVERHDCVRDGDVAAGVEHVLDFCWRDCHDRIDREMKAVGTVVAFTFGDAQHVVYLGRHDCRDETAVYQNCIRDVGFDCVLH